MVESDRQRDNGGVVKLEGTLDAFGLPDVLQLLGFSRKTGVLRLARGATHAQIPVRDGQVVATTSHQLATLLMWADGEFAFDPEAEVPSGEGVHHAGLLDEAQRVLVSWRSAAAALPADDVMIELGDVDGPVTLQPAQWALVRRIGTKAPVGSVCGSLEDRLALAAMLREELVVVAEASVVAPVFTGSVSVPSQPGGGFGVVGSLAMKPDILLDAVPGPGIHEVLLQRLVVAVRGL